MNDQNYQALLLLPLGLLALWIHNEFVSLQSMDRVLFSFGIAGAGSLLLLWIIHSHSSWGKNRKKCVETLREIPNELLCASPHSVFMGIESNLDAKIFLPDAIRTRHVHILGATGSGKTESVILNFLRQDIARGLGLRFLFHAGDG